uniref:Uncharacterized protein n=1 Tax=Oryza brachyantha TaxID=4533 RepID=J3MGH3_ORYBR
MYPVTITSHISQLFSALSVIVDCIASSILPLFFWHFHALHQGLKSLVFSLILILINQNFFCFER